jgi:hypothetical protein
MSIPNTPHLEPVQSSPEVVFPDRQASTEQVCDWIRAWHLAHHVTVDGSILRRVTWNGQWIHEQSPAQLESDIFSWGVAEGRGRMMVLDLIRERRNQMGEKPVCLTRNYICRAEEDNFVSRSPGGMLVVVTRLCTQLLHAWLLFLVALIASRSDLSFDMLGNMWHGILSKRPTTPFSASRSYSYTTINAQ